MSEDSARAIDAYQNFQLGILPSPGAWEQQTSAFARVVHLCNAERAFIQRKREKPPKKKKG